MHAGAFEAVLAQKGWVRENRTRLIFWDRS
jgi:hypothetical protein